MSAAVSPEVEPYPGARLLDFVANRMTMSSAYQPLVIKALVEGGGRCSAQELARVILLADTFAVARAVKILMRWPRRTLMKHQIAGYDRSTQEFVLPVVFASDEERQHVIDACAAAASAWDRREAPKVASRFYRVIEAAGGRCEACGVPGFIRTLDIDHIIPRAHARRGKVRLASGETVALDDPRNLQALCSRCNRGKRDSSVLDFRPSEERLIETMALTFERALELGYDSEGLLARVKDQVGLIGPSARGAIVARGSASK